jgi:hypothetical protein
MSPIFADAGIPMLALQMPMMVCLLIPVIIVETLLVRRWLPLTGKEAYLGTSVANVASTIVGVPFAWALMLVMELIITIPLSMAEYHWHWLMNSPVWSFIVFLASVAWFGPAEGNPNLYWMIPTALAILLIPSFIVSVWIETRICLRFWRHLDTASVRRAVFRANLASYGVLFFVACGLLAASLLTSG